MNRILVVEPRRLLQHATAMALFPDYEARMIETLPDDPPEPESYAAVIVDAAALREAGSLTGPALSRIELWECPVVWIDRDPPDPPHKHRIVCLKKPVARESIRAAVGQCLTANSPVPPADAPPMPAPASEKPPALAVPARSARIIELVDVVEEGTASVLRPRKPKKK